jgi:hypothetical protein
MEIYTFNRMRRRKVTGTADGGVVRFAGKEKVFTFAAPAK